MKQEGNAYFEWLPGYQEILACQEEAGKSESMEDRSLLPPEQLQQEEQAYWNDHEYLIRLLPRAARESWAAADAILDRYEYEGSAMYVEYPDKITVQRIADMVYEVMRGMEEQPWNIRTDGTQEENPYYRKEEQRGLHTPLRDMIMVMTMWNLAYRRQRYHRRKKVFPSR